MPRDNTKRDYGNYWTDFVYWSKRKNCRKPLPATHSLRAGFATVAAINGATEREIQKTTGHLNTEVLRRYIRDADIFRQNASRSLGL